MATRLGNKLLVQPAAAVIAPPNQSAYKPAGDRASRHDDPGQMPSRGVGRSMAPSGHPDVDGREIDGWRHGYPASQFARCMSGPSRTSSRHPARREMRLDDRCF